MTSTNVPNEILFNIISRVNCNSDLARLMLVSHRFKELVEPYLYRKIHLHAETGKIGYPPTRKRTSQLEENLRARPELGAYITALSLRVVDPFWYQGRPDVSLIRYMPRLRQLSYDPPPLQVRRIIPPNNEELTALRFNFSHLTDHYIENDGLSSFSLKCGIPLQIISRELSGWSHFSKLRKIQAEKLFFTPRFDPVLLSDREEMLFRKSSVEDLRFLDCCPRIHSDILGIFIKAVRHLKCFVLEINSPWDPLIEHNTPAPGIVIINELERHRGTIEELAISTPEQELDSYIDIISPSIKWTALKRLAIPEVMLLEIPLYRVNFG